MMAASATLFAGPAWAEVQYNTTTYVGCYSSAGGLSKSDSFIYQSYGHCQERCIPKSGENPQAVMGLNQGSDCWCGSALPPESDKVDNEQCDKGCTGFATDKCGGEGTFSIYLTGYDNSVGTAAGSSSGSSPRSSGSTDSSSTANVPPSSPAGTGSTTVSQEPSVITKAGETIVITASGQADATNQASNQSGGGSSKVGIAVGVVVGVIAICALVGAGVFFIRHRKRKAVEEEYRRNQAVNSFVTGDKPHSKGGSVSDQRLDPSLAHHRRQSDGSIADEMDFSRRILQVGHLIVMLNRVGH